jgi:coenzyme F420-reducing hydrogenase delta subunit
MKKVETKTNPVLNELRKENEELKKKLTIAIEIIDELRLERDRIEVMRSKDSFEYEYYD